MSADDAPKQQSDASDEVTEKASDGEAALHNKSDASVSVQAFPLAGISPRDLRKLVPPDVIQAAISEVQEPASAPVQIVEHSEYYAGPLPTAQMLADYDDVVPGCAEAIVENFTSEGDHQPRARKSWTTLRSGFFVHDIGNCAGLCFSRRAVCRRYDRHRRARRPVHYFPRCRHFTRFRWRLERSER